MTDKVATFQIAFKETYEQKEVYIHASARMVPAAIAPEINREHIINLLESNGYEVRLLALAFRRELFAMPNLSAS